MKGANYLKTFALMALMVGFMLLIGDAIGGRNGLYTALIFAVVMNFFGYWFSDKLILRTYGAQQVTADQSPQLYGIVSELSQRAGIPVPKIYIMENDSPNAFATGRNPNHAAVAVTTGIMRILTREELMGVIGHELGHVRNRDILTGMIAATMAGAIMMLASMARWGAIFGVGSSRDDDRGGGVIGMILISIFASIGATLIQMAISRSREYAADVAGAQLAGNPAYLASALRKLEAGSQRIPMQATPATSHMFIVNPLTSGTFARLFSTHPPIEERIAKLEEMARFSTIR